jgi:pimeloyl-CoA synthetase
MSIDVMELLTSQLKNLNLPQEKIGNILSQATDMGLDKKHVSVEEAQPMIAGLLGQNGISNDMIGQVVTNIMKDGFQISDITDVASSIIGQQGASKLASGDNNLIGKLGSILSGLLGKK